MLSDLLTGFAELLSWRVIASAYVVVGLVVVCYLDVRGRSRHTPRHERWNPRPRVGGSDLVFLGGALYPVLFLFLILVWPLWALYVWAYHLDDDEPNI